MNEDDTSNRSKNVFTYRFVHKTALLLPAKLKYKNASFLKSNANMANITVWQTTTNVHKTWAKKYTISVHDVRLSVVAVFCHSSSLKRANMAFRTACL